jgi:hypothetical protein
MITPDKKLGDGTSSSAAVPATSSGVPIPSERLPCQDILTMSRAFVTLAEKGVEAEAAARESLNNAYQRFISADGAEQKDEAGKDLIRAIFGRSAFAEDSVR